MVPPLFAAVLVLFHLVNAKPLEKRAICTVASGHDASFDDVPAVKGAIKSCGNGGVIVLSANTTYMVEGTLKLSDNTTFWNGVRAAILLTDVSGATVHSVTGTGLIDGNGVPFWQKFAQDSSFARPTLMYITGGSNIVVENLAFRNAPNVFHSATGGATNIIYRGLTLQAVATSDATPKNTDGFDIGPASFVTISSTTVENQDDCVAFKAGANFVTVTDITCSGSHGLSVGSLGESNNDTVSNIYVTRANMINSAKASGIKLWDGSPGHGIATVRNVTWDSVTVTNCDYAAQIQSCYEASSTCIPSKHVLTDVFWTNFQGTTSTAEDPVVANLNCPALGTCDITLENFNVKAPSGKANVLCSAVDSNLGITCSGPASG